MYSAALKRFRELDEELGRLRVRRIPRRGKLPVLIEDHHPAYISFDKYLETQERIKSNQMYQPNASTKPGRRTGGKGFVARSRSLWSVRQGNVCKLWWSSLRARTCGPHDAIPM